MPSWNNKVIWTEGMFLRPQHFQQQDRHFQNWVESRCNNLHLYSWGLTKLIIDEQQLPFGKFMITACSGVFPDGTPFHFPEDGPLPVPLDIPLNTKDETIYLALPLPRGSGKEACDNADEASLSRYHRLEINALDSHSQNFHSDAPIETGQLWTRLRLSSQEQGAYSVIPIARITERKPDNQVILDDHFIPSCLQCSCSVRITSCIQEIRSLLHHRGEALAKRLGSPGSHGAAEVSDFLLLQIINRYEPLFNHFAEQQNLHPESLYRHLIQMTGELSTITRPEHRPSTYPHYMHHELASSFSPIIDTLREALNWIPDFRAVPLPLEEHGHGIRTATISDPQMMGSASFIIAVNAQVPDEQLRSNFPRQTTIATVDKLRDLVMTHTPGIAIRALAVAPRQIPYHAGSTYFELDKHHELWKTLQQTGMIAVHCSGDYPGLKLELWAIKA